MTLTDDQLQELYDKQRLHENLMLYCRGVDRMDRELMRSTYWPDSTDDHGSYVGRGVEWADAVLEHKDSCHNNNHHVSNVLIEIDGNQAKREAMFMNVVTMKDPTVTLFFGGRYRDLCEKRDGVWKILNRVCLWDWCEQRVTKPAWEHIPQVTNWGAFYPDDPIYKDWSSSDPTPRPVGRS
jgi:SnoaL-like domain